MSWIIYRNRQATPNVRPVKTKEDIVMSKEGGCYFMKYKSEIIEMARIACATVPDDLCDRMDISDDFFIEVRDYIQWESDEKWKTTEE